MPKLNVSDYESSYLNVENFIAQFGDEEGVRTKITGAGRELIGGKSKIFIRLHGLSRPLVLNKTNIRSLLRSYGDDTDHWMNKPVEILVAETQSPSGESIRGLMVRPPLTKEPPPQANTAENDENAPY
jgi:hypothetical protein